jgi:cofilin
MSGSASGVKVDNTVIQKFHEFKIKKQTGYLVLGFSDDISKIVVLNEGVNKASQNAPAAEKNQKWAEMLDALPENDVRYVVIDIFYDTNDGAREEILFIAWAPDTATIKRKMLCASSKDALRHSLQGIRNHIQATCKADLDLAAIIKEKTKSK